MSKLFVEKLANEKIFDELVPGLTDQKLLSFACKNSFLAFCVAVKPGFIATKFHTLLANQLQTFYESVRDGKDARMIVECQPQVGKSTMVSELFPAWVLGLQGWPIIVASYGASLAETKSANCRALLDSPAYRMIFPDTKIDPETSAKDYWKVLHKNRPLGGAYRAVGVGGGLTGMSGKILVADDLFKDRQDADSETIRQSTWHWWMSVLMTRRQSKTGVAVVSTRWHMDDLVGKLEEQEKEFVLAKLPLSQYDQWNRFRFPAFAEEDEYFNDVLFRRRGEVLCPERFTHDDMVKTKNHTEAYDWSALYMQNPILQENAEFKQDWFRYYEPEEIKTVDLSYYTLVDLAVSQKSTADNTVVRTVAKDRFTGKMYLMEETAGHLDPLETIDAIFYHQKKYRSKVWVESVGYQAALQTFIIEEMRKRGYFFEVNELQRKNTTSKEARIRGLIPYYKAGMMFHRHSDMELEREMLQFPAGRHDDRVDALSFILDVAETTYRAQVEEPEPAFDPHAAFTRI